jgi:hypothetical protein
LAINKPKVDHRAQRQPSSYASPELKGLQQGYQLVTTSAGQKAADLELIVSLGVGRVSVVLLHNVTVAELYRLDTVQFPD